MLVKERFLSVVTAAVIISASGRALAQPQPTQAQPSLADRETARSLMDEADKKRDAGDLKGALKGYEAADAIMKVPTTGIEVARAQIALGLMLEARETLNQLLRNPPKPGEPVPFSAARKAAETLNAELANKIPSVQIVIQNADPSQTPQVSIDGEPIPSAAVGAPRKVNPGAHAIVVHAGSYEKKQDINVAEHENKTFTFDVKEHAGDQPPPVDETPQSTSTLPKVLMFGGFGLAIVGVGVGTATGIMSISKTSELKDVCPNDNCQPGKQGEIDSAKSLGNIATIAFIAGGVGLGAGIVGIVLAGSDKKEPAPPPTARVKTKPFAPEHVRAVLGPSYVGLAGAF
jgi:hypothetical protein